MDKYNYDGEKFLAKLYNDIHMKQSVIHSSKTSDKKLEKIRKYLEREEKIHQIVIEKGRLNLLKEAYYNKYIIKQIPKEYIDSLDKTNFNQTGYHLTEEEIEEHEKEIIESQRNSLSIWIDYLTSEDAKFYPWWAKYWAFQGMLKIGAYNNKNNKYGKRDNQTVAPFIELNPEVLSNSIDLAIKQSKGEITEENLNKLISSGSFTKLYTLLLKNQKKIHYTNQNIEGEWIKYSQGEEYISLFESLQGYNTGWCTAGESTCKKQIATGDFYVYYTKDENGEMKIPRLAIRMEGKKRIGEIRGVDEGQNIEPHLEDIIEKKLKDFPDTKKYQRRINDSKMLTYIYTKHEYKKELTEEDLKFIYEIDRKIESFGQEEDPRIEKIKEGRNIRKEIATILQCQEQEIGMNSRNVIKEGNHLKYYYGDLFINRLNVKNLKLPEIVGGNLSLNNLMKAENLDLPKEVRGNLNLRNLTSAKGINFPEIVEGNVYLKNLKNAEGLKLPKIVGGDLNLGNLTNAKGLELPKIIGGTLYLGSLIDAENIEFPEVIGDTLMLNSLTKLASLKLPKTVGGEIILPDKILQEYKLQTKKR